MPGNNLERRPIYLRTFTLRGLNDLDEIKKGIENNMIIIIRITPLAHRDVEELKNAVETLHKSVTTVGGDIARLGEERIILTPPAVKIWQGQ
jgi:SepF-like predicted cell division protein (DUF552 family)